MFQNGVIRKTRRAGVHVIYTFLVKSGFVSRSPGYIPGNAIFERRYYGIAFAQTDITHAVLISCLQPIADAGSRKKGIVQIDGQDSSRV